MREVFAGLLMYSAICCSVTGYMMMQNTRCSFGDNKQGNITFEYVITFNRQPVVAYNKPEDMFLPCSYCIPQLRSAAMELCTKLNTDANVAKYVKNEEKRCKEEINTFWDTTVERRVKPSMKVFSPVPVNTENLPVLVCYVWGFYPQNIIVAWIKNNNAVVKNYTQAVRVGDWTYQIVAVLDLRGSLPEDNYTCIVEHETLDHPLTVTWKAGLTSTQIILISVSTVVFVSGLITFIVGLVCWKNAKISGYSPIPGYNDVN